MPSRSSSSATTGSSAGAGASDTTRSAARRASATARSRKGLRQGCPAAARLAHHLHLRRPQHRGQGIARAALEGALDHIADAGGGLVEAIPEVTTGRQAQGRILFSTTVELFEQYGFTRDRQVGKHAWVVSKVVKAKIVRAAKGPRGDR